MTDIIPVIKDIGFPIFVAVWLLIKDNKEKQATREALSKLELAIVKLTEKLGGGDNGQT